MTRITLYEHPFACVQPQVFEVASLATWLVHHFGEVPAVRVQIFAGQPSADTEITGDVRAVLIGDAPEYVILQSPAGFDPFSWTALAIYAAVAAVAMVALMPKPVMPGNINRTQSSPNNALGNRENKVRMLERVEDIYGTVKSIPSLMMPTYNKYINHKKFEYGYYCIGRGYYDVAELRDGDTLIADINGASAAVYEPFSSPNGGGTPVLTVGDTITDKIVSASRAIEVDGITLKAPNQANMPDSAVYSFTPNATGGIITQKDKKPNLNTIFSVGDDLRVDMTGGAISVVISSGQDYDGTLINTVTLSVTAGSRTLTDTLGVGAFATIAVGSTITLAGFANAGNNGSFTVATKASDYVVTLTAGSQVTETAIPITLTVTRDYSGDYEVLTVSDGSVKLIPASSSWWTATAVDVTCSVKNPAATEWTDTITLDDPTLTEVWINIIAPNGIFFDSGGDRQTITITYWVTIEKLLPDLTPDTGWTAMLIIGDISGNTSDERAITIEPKPAWGASPVRVSMSRRSNHQYEDKATIVDEIKWADLYGVSQVSKTEFGAKTTIHTVTQATPRATAVKTRQLNCISSRKLPTYNGTAFSGAFDATGRHTSGTIAATSKLCDIIAAVSVDPKIGARTLATDVDMAQIWGVQQQLDAWNSACGQFNYTFDSDNTSFEETLVTIANAGFCIAYRQNGKIRLGFDKAQTASSTLFTHRNKKPHSETITRSFASDADHDGVEFTFVDPATDTSETISLPLDGSATKYKKFEIAGIRSFPQAWFRARREYAKLRGQRITLETTTTLDARSLLPNARIDVVDNTRFKSYDGEVVAQSGLVLTLSQPVQFAPSLPHSIVLMRRDGSLQSIPCTSTADPNKVTLKSLPSEAIVTQYGAEGVRTIFSCAADLARGAMAYLVQELDISDGQYATIRAINYSADYYSADTLAVPAKASVIN